MMRGVLLFLFFTGCGGSLVEHWDAGAGGNDGGPVESCRSAECSCTPCGNPNQCDQANGYSCVLAKEHGDVCSDSRFVCSTGN
jgi:hypothetical protein